jgi:hypothetical protein
VKLSGKLIEIMVLFLGKGQRSPIVDIEHRQLFSKNFVEVLFQNAGFEILSVARSETVIHFSTGYDYFLCPLR